MRVTSRIALGTMTALTLAGQVLADKAGHNEHGQAAKFVEPAGILTLTLLILTAATAMFIRRKRRPMLSVHKMLGALAVLAALGHAALVMLAE